MEKVYVVCIEDCYDLGMCKTSCKVFKDKEKAKSHMEEAFAKFLIAENIEEEDLKTEEEADDEEWVLVRGEDYIETFVMGYFVENHFTISIRESEVIE